MTRLILVGGFLGAGKTTLLWEAAHRIMTRGQRIGLITNDQAPELVDTVFLSRDKVKVSEVSGSCFCCNFKGLLEATRQVKSEANADVIIAEPVGSCTDLSATIIQPLKESMRNELLIAPFTVMVDPLQLTDILKGGTAGLHPSAAYIFRKQLEEGDIIVISKSELLSSNEMEILKEQVKMTFPDADVMTVSSKTGEGMDEWLQEVLTRTDAGKRLLEIDYDVYAEGEAVLGWLNSTIRLKGEAADWDAFIRRFMLALSQKFDSMKASVGHVKMMLEAESRYMIGNFTGKENTLDFRGSAGISSEARLTINARVEMSPEKLEQIIKDMLETTRGSLDAKVLTLKCLSPGRPNPTFRYQHVVPIYK